MADAMWAFDLPEGQVPPHKHYFSHINLLFLDGVSDGNDVSAFVRQVYRCSGRGMFFALSHE